MAKFMMFNENVRNAFDNDPIKFEAFSKLMIDTANGRFEEGITAQNANEKIVSIFRNIIGCDEKSPRPEVRKAIRRNQKVLFEVVEDVIEDLLVSGWQDSTFMDEFCDVRNLALGDRNDFVTEDNSILTVSKVSGNHWDLDRQRLGYGDHFSIETSWYGIAIYSEFEKLLTGAEDFAKFITKLYEAVDRYVNETIYRAMMSAADQLPGGAGGSGQWVKTGALNESTRETLITLVEDVQMASGASEVIIMGTKSALSKVTGLQNVDWISNDMKEERHTTGKIGMWEGIRLVEIKQGFALNDTSKYLVDDKVLFIMPVGKDNRFIKIVNEGEAQMRQVSDGTTNQDMTEDYRYMFKMGVGIQVNMRWGEWKLV